MQTPPIQPNPTTQPVLVTEQQLEGELGGLVGSPKKPGRGRAWLIVLIIVVALGALVWLALANNWFGSGGNSTLDNAATGLDSTPPDTNATNTASNTATNTSTNTAATDLTTAAGRDAARRDRLNLFVEAARAAVESHVNLPITTAPVKLNDSANAAVISIRQLLKDQDVTDETIDEYLSDPLPGKYYFGYNYDGQFLTLTAVLEVSGTDCTVTTTAGGQICILKKVVEL